MFNPEGVARGLILYFLLLFLDIFLRTQFSWKIFNMNQDISIMHYELQGRFLDGYKFLVGDNLKLWCLFNVF